MADRRHSQNIINKLREQDIDLVLVILDGSSRNLETSYDLTNRVIVPNLGKDKDKYILVAINQADVVMKGSYGNAEKNEPKPKLIKFLDDKTDSVEKTDQRRNRLDYKTNLLQRGHKEEAGNINQDEQNFVHDDARDYCRGIGEEMGATVSEVAGAGTGIGGTIGGIFGAGTVGKVLGGAVGGLVSGAVAVGSAIVDVFTGSGYITTTVCEEHDKADDCYELTMFRSFRDKWLRASLTARP